MLVLGSLAIAAPLLSPNDPRSQHADLAYAPPMPPRIIDHEGRVRRPFVYPLVVADRLERRYVADTARPVDLRFFSGGRLVSTSSIPWFPLGADPLGRDVFSRIADGSRRSLAVALAAVILSLAVGGAAGALAGYAGGLADRIITAVADFVVILPTAYVLVTLRATRPLVTTSSEVFWTMVVVLAAASWPLPARGVRAIVAAERQQAYAEAAYAAGATPLRILLRHLLPAAGTHLVAQAFLLFPAFILAEATLSFLGFGFATPTSSWGVMLQEAGRVSVITEAPWMLAPAGAIATAVLAMHLVFADQTETDPAILL